eukprot:m.47762 g.47762  ORF g.47762 m.47762 type:complete len:478 (-) comp6926_c0_seq1:286-1719(-)
MTQHIPGKLWVAVMTLILVAQHPSVGGRAGGTDAHGQRDAPRDLHVHWFAPFWSGGGYSSEAIAFAEALYGRIQRFKISQHGDSVNEAFVHGVPKKLRRRLDKLHDTSIDPDSLVAICHAEPGAWRVAGGARFQTSPCPPLEDPLYTIGRTMFETHRIPLDWVDRCNAMDEIWVPTEFHRATFTDAGVVASKLVVIPEPVDVVRFNPAAKGVRRLTEAEMHTTPWLQGGTLGGGLSASLGTDATRGRSDAAGGDTNVETFRFLSVFKWEERKGWKILLEAFVNEFSAADAVSLTLITNSFHTEDNLVEKVESFVEACAAQQGSTSIPHITVIDRHVPESNMPTLYRSMDCFVLPSRGEGWGRPHVEAMSMELPVIATNWSGPTAFLTEQTGYPLPINGLVTVPSGPFKKFHKWADPSVTDLSRLMRYVYTHRDEARAKGQAARQSMVMRFAPDKVADIVVDRLWQIHAMLKADDALG